MRAFRGNEQVWSPVEIDHVDGRAVHVNTAYWAAPGDVLWQSNERTFVIDAVDKDSNTLIVPKEVPWDAGRAYVIKNAPYRALPVSVWHPDTVVETAPVTVAPAPVIVAPAPAPPPPVVPTASVMVAPAPLIAAAPLPWGWLAAAGAAGFFFLIRRRGS